MGIRCSERRSLTLFLTGPFQLVDANSSQQQQPLNMAAGGEATEDRVRIPTANSSDGTPAILSGSGFPGFYEYSSKSYRLITLFSRKTAPVVNQRILVTMSTRQHLNKFWKWMMTRMSGSSRKASSMASSSKLTLLLSRWTQVCESRLSQPLSIDSQGKECPQAFLGAPIMLELD